MEISRCPCGLCLRISPAALLGHRCGRQGPRHHCSRRGFRSRTARRRPVRSGKRRSGGPPRNREWCGRNLCLRQGGLLRRRNWWSLCRLCGRLGSPNVRRGSLLRGNALERGRWRIKSLLRCERPQREVSGDRQRRCCEAGCHSPHQRPPCRDVFPASGRLDPLTNAFPYSGGRVSQRSAGAAEDASRFAQVFQLGCAGGASLQVAAQSARALFVQRPGGFLHQYVSGPAAVHL